jgi:molecular chaperone GrpE
MSDGESNKTTKQQNNKTDDQKDNTEEKSSNVDLVEEYKNKWLRAVADYQNLKKDTAKEKVEWVKFANAGLILELLPILNHFKEAIKHVPAGEETKDWVVGIFHIKKQLEDFLKNLGIEEIKTVGEKFDPEFHEAIDHREVEGTESDQVVEEVQPGYMMQGKVIEPAKVVVAK